jgi:hypothetical protein
MGDPCGSLRIFRSSPDFTRSSGQAVTIECAVLPAQLAQKRVELLDFARIKRKILNAAPSPKLRIGCAVKRRRDRFIDGK